MKNKENLLTNARYALKKVGGHITIHGQYNNRKVSIHTRDGRSCVVWYPVESRIKDLEIQDLKDAVTYMTGQIFLVS